MASPVTKYRLTVIGCQASNLPLAPQSKPLSCFVLSNKSKFHCLCDDDITTRIKSTAVLESCDTKNIPEVLRTKSSSEKIMLESMYSKTCTLNQDISYLGKCPFVSVTAPEEFYDVVA